MKKVLLVVFALYSTLSISQVRVDNSERESYEPTFTYDSTKNFDHFAECMRGQELFLAPLPKEKIKEGYYGFKKHDSSTRVKYEEVSCHNFDVIDVVDGKTISLTTKLIIKDKKTSIVYDFSYPFYEVGWPFITIGFKEKYEKKNKGKEFVFLSYHTFNEFNTGNPIELSKGDVIKFSEIIATPNVPAETFGYMYSTESNDTIVMDKFYNSDIVEKKLVDSYTKKYGKRLTQLAIDGDIEIGMPDDLVIIANGRPDDINRASYGEQWVYKKGKTGRSYIYFKKGKVTGWN